MMKARTGIMCGLNMRDADIVTRAGSDGDGQYDAWLIV
jgi:hypothetical protein